MMQSALDLVASDAVGMDPFRGNGKCHPLAFQYDVFRLTGSPNLTKVGP